MKTPDFEGLQLPNNDIIKNVTDKLHNNLNKQLEDAVIEGLKRKGFEFKHPLELEAFIKERCRCEDNIDLKERVYFVDNKPFFLHKYKYEIITDPSITGNSNTIVGELGAFTYL